MPGSISCKGIGSGLTSFGNPKSVSHRGRWHKSQAIGRSRGGGSTQIKALTDALGNLTDCRLLPGQAHDLRGTAVLNEGLSCGKLFADRAFDANWPGEAPADTGIEAVIPPGCDRRFPAEFDRDTCKWRRLTGNFFGKLKEYRGAATRCCKTDTSFSAFIAIAATVIRLR